MKRSASGDIDITKIQKLSVTPATTHSKVVLTHGCNRWGQLGFELNSATKNKPSIVTSIGQDIENICAGFLHTICLTTDKRVITFGYNVKGALGRNASTNLNNCHTPGFVELQGKAIEVSAGYAHSAALLEDGKVFAWGSFTVSKSASGLTVGANGEAVQADAPVEMLPGEKVVKIASGSDHLVMLTEDGRVFTCGCGAYGQLGRDLPPLSGPGSRLRIGQLLTPGNVPGLVNRLVTDVWATPQATFVKIDDEIYACGRNDYSQLGMSDTKNKTHMVKAKAFNIKSWVQICGGTYHVIARDDQGVVYALGRMHDGRLGLGAIPKKNVTELTAIPVLADKKCVDIACGNAVSLAVTDEGTVYSWGWVQTGQLGDAKFMQEVLEPRRFCGKELESTKPFRVSVGYEHSAILATKAVPL